jgi:hypothetical protein
MVKKVISEKELADEISVAKKAGLDAQQNEPRAIAARYDKKSERIIVDLKTGISFMFPTELAEGLSDASDDELKLVKVIGDGFAIFWEDLDVVLSVPDLLMGVFGSKNWMSKIYSEIGRKGGKRTSPSKAKASRENGRLGGRPKKSSAN